MNSTKQVLLLFAFIITGTGFLLAIIISIVEKTPVFKSIPIILLAGLPLALTIYAAIKFESKLKKEHLSASKAGRTIVEWKYTQEEWMDFASKYINHKQKSYYAWYFGSLGVIILFLFGIHEERSVFYSFLTILGLLMLSIIIAISKRLKKLKKVYILTTNPVVKINVNSIIINSEEAISFNLHGRIKFIELEEYLQHNCLCIGIEHKNGRGLNYKFHYIPIPSNNNIDVNILLEDIKEQII